MSNISRAETLIAFEALTEERGPSARELQKVLRLSSPSVAHYRIRMLINEGLVEHIGAPGDSRGYRLTALGRAKAQQWREVYA